jgi:glycerol-3-phosphate dehydrogenase
LASPSSLERLGLPTPIAQHLADSYGDKAAAVAAIAAASSAAGNASSASSGGDGASSANVELGPLARPLARGFPFIEAEVVYAARHEYAQTAVDVLARRTRLAFLHRGAAERALPRVVELMSAELGWSAQRRADEAARARVFLRTMGHEGRGSGSSSSGSGSADGVSGEDSAADDFDGAVSNRGWSRLCMHVHSVCTIFSRQSILSCLCLNTQ